MCIHVMNIYLCVCTSEYLRSRVVCFFNHSENKQLKASLTVGDVMHYVFGLYLTKQYVGFSTRLG